MPCAFCGEGDRWIKTCLSKDGSRIRVCDPCWEVLAPWLVIVPGDEVVTARCKERGATLIELKEALGIRDTTKTPRI